MYDDAESHKIKALFKNGRSLKFEKNEMILRAGDNPQGVYLIKSGVIKVYSLSKQGDEHVHHFFGPGDIFPMIWIFRGYVRNVFYEALEPTKLLVIPRDELLDFVNKDEAIMRQMLDAVIDRYRLYAGRIDNLLYSDARERCAYRLLSLANRFGVKTAKGVVIKASITHEDLAHSINMTRETFGRSLARLQRKGMIAYDKDHHFIIKDMSGLINIIGRDEFHGVWPELKQFDD